MSNYFITYGDDAYKYSKIHLIELAKKSNRFDKFLNLGPKSLSKQFRNEFTDILKNKRGGGYWVWKHEIIMNLLLSIKENDIILYCDAGSSINNLPKANKRLDEYFEIINDKNNTFLRFETEKNFIENQYTSKEVFKAFNVSVNSEIATSTQLQAGVMFLKKNNESIDFFKNYKKILKSDNNLITDFYTTNQSESFIENRHDQSLFSVLGKQYESFILENETEFRNRKNLQYDFPILTVRASNHGMKDKVKLTLLKNWYAKKTKYF